VLLPTVHRALPHDRGERHCAQRRVLYRVPNGAALLRIRQHEGTSTSTLPLWDSDSDSAEPCSYSIELSSTLYSSVLLYCIVYYSIVYYTALFYSIELYTTLLYTTLLCSILLNCILLYCILYCSVLFY
jgi:hypothetical protein